MLGFTRSPRQGVVGLVGLFLAAGLTMTACGGATEAVTTAKPDSSTDAFASAIRSESMDFEPHSSPESLGEEADLSVVGTVRSIDDGRVFGGGDEPEFPNVTLTVRVDKVLAGDQSLVTDGEVFVELPRSARGTAKQLQDTMPVDQEVILFLDDYSSGMGTFAVTQEASSVPDGAPIFAPYADGILLEDTETGKIVGGYVPLDELDTPWRSGIGSIDEFVAEHFSGV